MNLGFGQPDDGIIQLGYVVRDLDAAMAHWRTLLRSGPWFVLHGFKGVDPLYRGEPATALCDVALGFAGHMQIELIQPLDDQPSVYRRADGSLIEGFHHYGVAARDFDQVARQMEARGFEAVFTAAVPSGGRVAYYDVAGTLPGMIELIEADSPMDEMFTRMYQAGVEWDGADPVRQLGG